MAKASLLLSLLAAVTLTSSANTDINGSLGVNVTKEQNREYSFTDKKSGFWYGRTHQDTPVDWFAGWNIAKKRVLSDFEVNIDYDRFKRSECQVTVSPSEITWDGALGKMSFKMIEGHPALYVHVEPSKKKAKNLYVMLNFPEGASIEDFLTVRVYSIKERKLASTKNGMWKIPAKEGGFVILHGNQNECDSLINLIHPNSESFYNNLMASNNRIANIINVTNPIKTNLPEIDKAMQWITLTMDQLVTEQQGKGIYAGLPWFNEYWGRDMFIAMPGSTLISGQFDYSKEILKDFAKFQDTDPNSSTCGRIPNRANPEGILYNTADGTPRYVIEAEELLQYSGDQSFLKEIYPSIVLSTDQSLQHHTDSRGYLTHDDADTWMDVVRNGVPGSPRGNRANDIQFLWYRQLTAAAHLARLMKDYDHASAWTDAANKVAANFEQDFCDKNNTLIYDHLNVDGTPDLQMRPNQLFCFELVKDEGFKQKLTRRCWEELVYPWGVASLSQTDLQFHPQHENWNYYHKDDAYHNGTIWLWNNGIAMQRMIEYGQKEMAWQLFKNMCRQALDEGAVGSLSENADAHPREGKQWVDRSGTFLQAWSNSEHLRVWYQYFLGIRPDLMENVVVVEPKIPSEITDIETSMIVGKGRVVYKYHNGKFDVTLENLPSVKLDLRIASEEEQKAVAGNPIFNGIDFCHPQPLDHYPCFDKYFDPPLTY